MNSLKTLGALVVGVILLAAFYAASFNDHMDPAHIESDGGEGVRQIVSGDRGEFSLNQADLKIKASWRGDYELSEDGGDIESLDHKLEISREANGLSERAVFERDGDAVERSYYIDGEKQEDGDAADDGARNLLVAFLGASGAKAEERVAALLREGGPDAVISELGEIYGDHARERYAAVLTEQTDLTPDQLRALVKALKTIESDHDLRQALGAVMENETIGPDEAPLILEAADRIESDYDLRRLIETVAEKPMRADAIALAISLMERLDSDHDLRRASEAYSSSAPPIPIAAIMICAARLKPCSIRKI